MTDLDLETRAGLPEHLRILAEKYPRGEWTGHANFNELTRFWLDRHLMFRDLQARMQAEAEGFLDGNADPRQFGQAVYRLGGFFINQLHGHHQIEDMHYFPMLSAKEPRLEAAFALLDKDHHALDGVLQGLTTDANGVLQALQTGEAVDVAAGRFRDSVTGMARFLDRHLTDEEEIVVPVILEHGADELG